MKEPGEKGMFIQHGLREKFPVLLSCFITFWAFAVWGTFAVNAGPMKIASINEPEGKFPAPVFELEDIENRKIKLDDFQGKVILLVFWATW